MVLTIFIWLTPCLFACNDLNWEIVKKKYYCYCHPVVINSRCLTRAIFDNLHNLKVETHFILYCFIFKKSCAFKFEEELSMNRFSDHWFIFKAAFTWSSVVKLLFLAIIIWKLSTSFACPHWLMHPYEVTVKKSAMIQLNWAIKIHLISFIIGGSSS